MKYRVLAITFPLVLLFDQWSKLEILKRFRFGESLPFIPGFFAFTYVRNTGAAFSIFHNAPPSFREPFFMIVPLVILTGLGIYFYRLPKERIYTPIAISLIMSGAIGNLIDRVRLGYVVDFIHFHWKEVYHYPMFNIADSCIVVGVILVCIETFYLIPRAEKRAGIKS